MYGLSASHWAIIIKLLLEPLKEAHCKVYIFGSRARGDHRRFSDLDVLVECPGDMAGLLSQVRDDLEQSELPIKVDLVEARYLADSYRENVKRDRVRV